MGSLKHRKKTFGKRTGGASFFSGTCRTTLRKSEEQILPKHVCQDMRPALLIWNFTELKEVVSCLKCCQRGNEVRTHRLNDHGVK